MLRNALGTCRSGNGQIWRRRGCLRTGRGKLVIEELEQRNLFNVTALVAPTANGDSTAASLSNDGRFVAFQSTATNLVPGQVQGSSGNAVFLLDRVTKSIALVSHASGAAATTANAAAQNPVDSSDGRFVAYVSAATNLMAGQVDTNNATDVFLYDRISCTSTLVSHSTSGLVVAANGPSSSPVLSADGRFVAFVSSATDLVAGQPGASNGTNVFLYDRLTGLSVLVSHTSAGSTIPGNDASFNPVVSADGRYVAYQSASTNLVAGQVDANNGPDVFLYDRLGGANTLVSHACTSGITAGNGPSFQVALSSDGNFIAFASTASNLIPREAVRDSGTDVFLYDRAAGVTTLVSHASASATGTGNNASRQPLLSSDGRFVDFLSQAGDLVAGQTGAAGITNVFLYDRLAGTNALISHASASPTAGANDASDQPALSGDGRFIAFESLATNLVAGQTEPTACANVFLYDAQTGASTLASRALTSSTTGGSADSLFPGMSADGGLLVFESRADNLVAGGLNGHADLFAQITRFDDLIGRNQQTGQWWTGVSDGSASFNIAYANAAWAPGLTWVDVQTGDFNGDGKTDLIGRVSQTGEWWVSLSTGTGFLTTRWATWNPGVTWTNVRVGDFTGNGKSDIAGQVLQDGTWWVGLSTGTGFVTTRWGIWSPWVTWVDVLVGDLNGDGKDDLIGRVKESGQWWAALSTGTSFTNALWGAWAPEQPGVLDWVDVRLGDLNGDGRADVVGRLSENGQWWVSLSGPTGFLGNSLWTVWATGIPWVDVNLGDFDGTGRMDLIARSLQTGQWWLARSTGTSFVNSLWTVWSPGVTWVDVQVGDFNGDGMADITGRVLQDGSWWTSLSAGSAGGQPATFWGAWNPGTTWGTVQQGRFN